MLPTIAPPFLAKNSTPYVTNADDLSFLNWRAGRANAFNGVSNSRIMCLGDSTTVGTGSVTGGVGAGIKLLSYPTLLAKILTANGYPASVESVFGDFGYGQANSAVYDSRIVWGDFSPQSVRGPGGQSFGALVTSTNPMTFTPNVQTDTLDVYFATNAGLGGFSVSADAGGATNYSTSAAAGYGKITFSSGSLASHVYKIKAIDNNHLFIVGMVAYNSAVKQVSILNMGYGGSLAVENSSNLWQSLSAVVAAYAPSLVIIDIGINDALSGTALSTFQTQVQTQISAAVNNNADVLLVIPIPTNPASIAASVTAGYQGVIRGLAQSNNVPLLDMASRIGAYAPALAKGFYYSDGVHGTGLMYQDLAAKIASLPLSQ
jgi:lysophospholipase L1-like esterase